MMRFPTLLPSLAVLLVCSWGFTQDTANPQGDFGKDLPRLPRLSVAESHAAIQIADGFQVELAAAEPVVHDPVAVDFDARGRMYVVQLPPYNAYVLKDFKQQGSVAILEDRDHDGRYERRTLFAEGLKYPTAVACWDGGVFVGDAPDLLYMKDTDGDGKADVRRVVLTGFGTDKAGEAHLNSIRWGLDNRFHFSTSLSGGAVRAAPESSDAVSVRNRGMIFDPRSGEFELTSGGGQHGMSMDDWGRKFVCSNSVPAQQLMYDDRYAARNPSLKAPAPAVDIAPDQKYTKLYRISPPEPWRVLRTKLRREGKFRGSDEGGTPFGFFTGATGVTIYRGDNWPDSHHGNLLVGDVANNLVYRAKLQWQRESKPSALPLVALRADEHRDFLASADIWFRPVQFANAPDGTLYVLDMHRELIEGAAFLPPAFLEHLDASSGWDEGRIYRIVAADRPLRRAAPDLEAMSSQELVALLDHPNGWHRDTASRLLYRRNDRSVAPQLRKLARMGKRPQGRAAAMSALRGIGLLDPSIVEEALQSDSAELRAFALQLCEPLLGGSPGLQRAAAALQDDPHPWVRYQLAFSLGAMGGGGANVAESTRKLWLQALAHLVVRDGADPWMAMATLSSLPSVGGGDLLQRLTSAARGAFCESAHGQAYLSTLVQHLGKQPTEVPSVVRVLTSLHGSSHPALRQLAKPLTESLLATQPAPRRAELLAAATGDASDVMAEWLARAEAAVADERMPASQRRQAIMTLRLTDISQSIDFARKLLGKQSAGDLQLAAIDLLATYDAKQVADHLVDAWPQLTPTARARATEVMLSRSVWAARFLDALEQGSVDVATVDGNRMSLLREHPDDAIAGRAAKLFPAGPAAGRQALFAKYQAALEREGSAAKGKQLFKKNCAACHQLDGVGTTVGADLRGIASRGLPSVLLNVLDPNREVKPKFLTYAIQTEDGRVLSGMILNESANSVTLRQADGVNVSLQRDEIARIRETGKSFMPEGLEKELSVEDMAHLLSFLAEAG